MQCNLNNNWVLSFVNPQVHAEDIDKANDLHKLGGMEPLYKLLAMKVPPAVTQLALHTLGSAASHNPQVAVLHQCCIQVSC